MPIEVKICGINSLAAADAALAAHADFGGLVFFAQSPRHLSLEQGETLARRMRGLLRLVALAVDESDATLSLIAKRIKPDFFQLHGKETPRRCAEIASRFGVPLIKALPLATADDLGGAQDYAEAAAMFLFDAPAAVEATRPGGHGAAFDWKILKDKRIARPWFLAGGLSPENVARAIEASGAQKVDVSSGVETAPGLKSESRIHAFALAARETVRA